MSQSAGPRIISKFVEGVVSVFDADGDPRYSLSTATNHSGWVVADATQGVLQWQGYIDLHGYRPDDMVLAPRAVQVQYGANWFSRQTSGAPGGSAYLQYAITTDKIDDLDFGNAGVSEPLAGFIGDNSEMDQVIYGCSEFWTTTSRGGGLTNAQKMEYGDGVPIVGPRVYISIRVQLQPAAEGTSTSTTSGGTTTTVPQYGAVDTSWFIPPMRFVIAGDVGEVPEFQLLHLMKRQIDLQQTPDVDV